MLEFVNVLMKILILEGVLLTGLVLSCLVLLLKQFKGKSITRNVINEVVLEFKKNVSLKADYTKLYKTVVVLFGVTKLTAIWCFSVLFGVMITSDIWVIVGILVLEVMIIAIEINNRFAIDEEKVINLLWLLRKIEKSIQKIKPDFSVEEVYSNIKKHIKAHKESK